MVSSTEEPISNTQKSKKHMMANSVAEPVKRNENGKQVATPEPVFPSSPENTTTTPLGAPIHTGNTGGTTPPIQPIQPILNFISATLQSSPTKKIDLDPFLANESLQVPLVNIRHADSLASSISASEGDETK